jgi:hypothetical protein
MYIALKSCVVIHLELLFKLYHYFDIYQHVNRASFQIETQIWYNQHWASFFFFFLKHVLPNSFQKHLRTHIFFLKILFIVYTFQGS